MRRSLVIMLVLVAVLLGLTACGTSSSKASTTTKSTPSSVSRPKPKANAQRAKARLHAYIVCLQKHGVTFKSGTKTLTAAAVRAEPKYTSAVAICKAPAVTPTTKKSSG
jgi:Flp pilus assembly protein TadD